MDWFGLTQSLSMASFREHYLPLGLSGAPWSGCSCFGASARTRFPRILSKVRVGSCLNSESFDSLAPAYLKLAPSPTRSLLPSQFYLLCRFSQKLHSTCRFAHLCRSTPVGSHSRARRATTNRYRSEFLSMLKPVEIRRAMKCGAGLCVGI